MPEQQIYGDRYFNPDDSKNQLPPKKKTQGEILEEEGGYLKDPETEIDTSQPMDWVAPAKSDNILLQGLGYVGAGMDYLDKKAGIPGTDIDVYHARQKIIQPLSEQHFILGMLGEIFIPDTIDIATMGLAYIPNRFRKSTKVLKAYLKARKAALKASGKVADAVWQPVAAYGQAGLALAGGYGVGTGAGWAADIVKQHKLFDYAYNFPKVAQYAHELKKGYRKLSKPLKKGTRSELVENTQMGSKLPERISVKDDIDLDDFDWLNDPMSYQDFEVRLREIIELDDIAASDMTQIAWKGGGANDAARLHTGQKGVSQMYYDYLNGYFNRWIRTGIENNFDNAAQLLIPGSGVKYNNAGLVRALRRQSTNPEVWGNKAFKAGTKEYKDAVAKLIEEWNLRFHFDQNPHLKKFEAHHLNVIDESWNLYAGLPDAQWPIMRQMLEKKGVFTGDAFENVQLLPKEIHSIVHNKIWPKFRPKWAGKDAWKSEQQLIEIIRSIPTAKGRKHYVDQYANTVKQVNFHIERLIDDYKLSKTFPERWLPEDLDRVADYMDAWFKNNKTSMANVRRKQIDFEQVRGTRVKSTAKFLRSKRDNK